MPRHLPHSFRPPGAVSWARLSHSRFLFRARSTTYYRARTRRGAGTGRSGCRRPTAFGLHARKVAASFLLNGTIPWAALEAPSTGRLLKPGARRPEAAAQIISAGSSFPVLPLGTRPPSQGSKPCGYEAPSHGLISTTAVFRHDHAHVPRRRDIPGSAQVRDGIVAEILERDQLGSGEELGKTPAHA